MTRLHDAATTGRALRALVSIGAVIVLALVASGCMSSPPPAPPADPFAGLADRSDQAFREGLEAYGQGQYREALTAFDRARVLSPTADPRITQMIERSRAALAPTPTAVPPTPTSVPLSPTPTPVAMATQAPDTELGRRYFGDVSLAMVPGRETDAPPATQFFFQDQVGLRIDGLKQHLRLPFTLRVFNTDSNRLVAEVQSDDLPAPTAVATAAPSTSLAALLAAAQNRDNAPATPLPSPTAIDTAFRLARFWDSYVWYHKGGEQPGRYRVELFAANVLTNVFDYSVGTVPVPTPEPTVAPTLEPSPSVPTLEPAPAPSVPAPAVAPRTAPASGPVVQVATPLPTLPPTPTVVPTPAQAYTTVVGGAPAGLDVDSNTGRFFLADSSGVIWSADAMGGQQRPTLGTPFNIGARQPVDLAADKTTGYLYLSTRACAPAAPGCILVVDGRTGALVKSISLPGSPADLRLDPDMGLLYVSIPERQALGEIDIRGGRLVQTITGLPQITSLAIDPLRHTLYAAHLAGQLTAVDVPSGQVIGRFSLTGAGLSSVATARGLAYAVNTATHELAVVEPFSRSITRYVLGQEPSAVAAAEDSGAVYVLSSRSDLMLQIDPTDGTEIGRVLLASRASHTAVGGAGVQTLRPRMVLNATDDTLFASLPEAGTLAAVTIDQFPVLARAIPYVDVPDYWVAETIPGVLQPAAAALPSQPAPVFAARAQAPDPEPTTTDTDEEGL
jgi:hypothetical protein